MTRAPADRVDFVAFFAKKMMMMTDSWFLIAWSRSRNFHWYYEIVIKQHFNPAINGCNSNSRLNTHRSIEKFLSRQRAFRVLKQTTNQRLLLCSSFFFLHHLHFTLHVNVMPLVLLLCELCLTHPVLAKLHADLCILLP